jgi:hypothetical protein
VRGATSGEMMYREELAPLVADEDENVSSTMYGYGIEGKMGWRGLGALALGGRGCRAGSASRTAALSALGAAPRWATTGQEMARQRHRGGDDAMDSRSQMAKVSGLLTTMAIKWWWWSGDGFESESRSSRSRTQTYQGPAPGVAVQAQVSDGQWSGTTGEAGAGRGDEGSVQCAAGRLAMACWMVLGGLMGGGEQFGCCA